MMHVDCSGMKGMVTHTILHAWIWHELPRVDKPRMSRSGMNCSVCGQLISDRKGIFLGIGGARSSCIARVERRMNGLSEEIDMFPHKRVVENRAVEFIDIRCPRILRRKVRKGRVGLQIVNEPEVIYMVPIRPSFTALSFG